MAKITYSGVEITSEFTTKSGTLNSGESIGELFGKTAGHIANRDNHVTAAEKKYWNTLSVKNELDNPDFRVNQRGAAGTISAPGYFVDRWKLISGSVTVNADNTLTLDGAIAQILEKAAGADATASSSAGTASYDNSTSTFTLTASGEVISWAKLEIGSTATPFVPPDRALELIKCLRFFRTISRGALAYCVNSKSVVFRQTFEYPMRDTPAVSVLNPKPILTYSGGWIEEPDSVSIISANLTAYGVCYLHVGGFSLKVGEQAFALDYPFALATDNVFGLSADF